MSGYIAELRRELVDAADRERRRSAPRRAFVRARRPVAAALAMLSLLIAVGVGIALLGREEPPPVAEPRIVATIQIGGQPLDAAPGAGAVWVSDATGRVLRVDPETRRLAAEAPAGDEAAAISASDSAVWVATRTGFDRYQVLRVDPRDNRVVGRSGRVEPYVSALEAASPGAVWAQLNKPGPLQRINPRTNRLEGDFSTRHATALASRSGVLWALGADGVLERRDAASGRLLGRQGGFARFPFGGDWSNAIATDADGAWVATGPDGKVAHVALDGEMLAELSLGANGPIAVAGRWLWVTIGDISLSNGQLVRVDRMTGEVTGRLRLGSRIPRALVAVGDDVWAVIGDGTVLVIR
jgi:hypothetical protein